jgi:Leucine-rich repeat (LRR) protein
MEEHPVVDRLQLKRIAAAVGAPLTDADLSDPLSLVRPNKRGRIAVANIEEWLAPLLPALEPPNKHVEEHSVTVDLSGCVLGSTGAQVLAGCLQAPPLRPHEGSKGVTELNLSGCGLGDAAIAAVAAAPEYWDHHNQRLEIHRHKFDHGALVSLSLKHNKFSKAGLKSLCHPALGLQLHSLDLSDNNIGTPGALAVLSTGLMESRVASLGLARCKIGSNGCLALGSNELPESLTALDLSGNRITRSAEVYSLTAKLDYDSTGWAALCDRLLVSNVATLKLASNRLGADGAAVLAAQGMGDWFHCKLLTLDLSDNSLRSSGVVALSVKASNTPIRQLLLGGNEISASGLAGMCDAYNYATRLRGKMVGMDPIAVRELDLSGVMRSEEGVSTHGHWQAQLAQLLDELPRLRFLTINLGRHKAYTLCAESADRCVYCGASSEDTPVHYAAVGNKCCWCESCSRKQQSDAEDAAAQRLALAQQELEAQQQKLEEKQKQHQQHQQQQKEQQDPQNPSSQATVPAVAAVDKDEMASAEAVLKAAKASVQLAEDFVLRMKRRKGAEDVVLSLHLAGAGLSPADGLLVGAWLAQPTQAATLNQLNLSHNHLLSRVVLQRADGAGGSDEAEMRGLQAVASALRSSSVTVLQLTSCEIGPAAMKTLALGLPNCLEELDVSANPLKAGGLAALGSELPRVNLTVLTMELGQQKRTMRADRGVIDLAGEELKPHDMQLLGGWLRMPIVRESLTELVLGKRSDCASYSVFSAADCPPTRGWEASDGSLVALTLIYDNDSGAVTTDDTGSGSGSRGRRVVESFIVQGAGDGRFNGTYRVDGERYGKPRYRKQLSVSNDDDNDDDDAAQQKKKKKKKKQKSKAKPKKKTEAKAEEIIFFSCYTGTAGMWSIGLHHERDECEADEPPKYTSLGNRLLTRHGSGAEAGMQGIEALAAALPELTRLRSLSLHKTFLGPVSMQHLGPALPTNLQRLDVSANRLDTAGKALLGAQLRRLGLQEIRVDLGRGCSTFSNAKASAKTVSWVHVKAGYCAVVDGRACEIIDPGQQRRVTRCSEEGVRAADVRVRWLDNSNETFVKPQQLRSIVCSQSDLVFGHVDSTVVLLASAPRLTLRGLTLLPDDTLLIAGWLLSSTVQSSVQEIDLSENRLVGHLINGPEVPHNGVPFEGEAADKHLRPLHCNSAILKDSEWRDDIGAEWEDSKKKDVIARAAMSWAVQSVLETGQKEPDGNARLFATTDSSRGIVACVCHWAVSMTALCASIASLDRMREVCLCNNGIGPIALTHLALHGLGLDIEAVDISDNPLVTLDWQGNELAEEMPPVEGLLRRSFGMVLRHGILGLGRSAPQLVAPKTRADQANLGCMTLGLSGTHFGPLALAELCKLQSRSLQCLELGRNKSLGRHGKKLLAKALRDPHSLVSITKLVIGLGSVPAVVLCDTTTELDLRGKALDDADLSVVGACLTTGSLLKNLVALDLSVNPAIGTAGKIALASGLAAGDAPVIRYGCFGLGRKCEHALYLDAQADEIVMCGKGLGFGDVALLAGCLSPRQRAECTTQPHKKSADENNADGEQEQEERLLEDRFLGASKAMGMGSSIVKVDLSDNGLTDSGVSPLLAALAPAEAARQQTFVMTLREKAAAAKEAMAARAGPLGLTPEVTPEEEAEARRAKVDGQMEPLLLALANGAVQPPGDHAQVWGFATTGVPPPQLTSLLLAGNDLGTGSEGGFVQPDPDGPRIACSAIAVMLCTALTGGGGGGSPAALERLCLARNPLFSGSGDRSTAALCLALPMVRVAWLDMTDCGVGSAGGIALADAVSERPFELVIHKNSLGKEGKAALGQAIPTSKYGERAAKQAEVQAAREQAEDDRAEAKALKQAARDKAKAEAEAARAEANLRKAEARALQEKEALERKQAARAASEAARLKLNEEEARQAALSMEERIEQVNAAMDALQNQQPAAAAAAAATEEEADQPEDDAWKELERSLTGSSAAEAAQNEVIRAAQEKMAEHRRAQAEMEQAERASLEKARRAREKTEKAEMRKLEQAAAAARREKQAAQAAAKRQLEAKKAAAAKVYKAEQKRWAPAVKAERQAAAAAHRSEMCLLM